MKMKRPHLRLGLVALVYVAVTASMQAQAPPRVVAIGDVHGAYTEFVSILQRTGLIDSSLNWAGKDTIFVQVGDILDRGPDSRKALDLMMKLEQQAPKQNGRIIPLLGNHEVMDMVGDTRYVSAAEFQAFSSDQSEKIREQEFESYRKFMASRGAGGTSLDVPRDRWMADHPIGFFELRDAYGPKGEYGKWFRSHDVVAEVGDTIFLHGGLDPKERYDNIPKINKRAHAELSDFDSLWKALGDEGIIWPYMTMDEAFKQLQGVYQQAQSNPNSLSPVALQNVVHFLRDFPHWSIMSPDGPLWYRELAAGPEAPLQDSLISMLGKLKAEHIVMGHTVMTKDFSITPRFNDHAFLIDTGMLSFYFHGRPSALNIEGGRYTAVYADGQQVVLVNPKASQGGAVTSQAANGK